MAKKLLLTISRCINCRKQLSPKKIKSDTLVHACDDCISYLRGHGRYPLNDSPQDALHHDEDQLVF